MLPPRLRASWLPRLASGLVGSPRAEGRLGGVASCRTLWSESSKFRSRSEKKWRWFASSVRRPINGLIRQGIYQKFLISSSSHHHPPRLPS